MSVLSVGIAGVGASAYDITKSMRCRGSQRLTRSFNTPTNNTVWAFSIWFKKSFVGSWAHALLGRNDFTETCIKFNENHQLTFVQSGSILATSTKVFRDPTHHMHVHIRSTGTAVEAYVNSELVLSYTGTMTQLNSSAQHVLAAVGVSGSFYNPAQGYISEINFVDGQALLPSSFGQSINGGWQPKQYSGTYGNNGSRLNFSDGTSLTTLGADSSGNGNNWTLTGFSITAGPTYDWMDDTPTNNYATANPLKRHTSNGTISSADLLISGTSGISNVARDCTHRVEGPIYFEVTVAALVNYGAGYATVASIGPEGVTLPSGGAYGVPASPNGVRLIAAAPATSNWLCAVDSSPAVTTNLSGFSLNDVAMVAFDPVSGKFWVGRNGTWANSGNPSTGANPTVTGVSSAYKVIGMHAYADAVQSWQAAFNFGQRPFTYTKPTGFNTLCADNISNTAITTSGTFTGNANTDGPFVFLNGEPLAMTINGNAVTWGTHADKLAGGFKVRSSAAGYNTAGSNTYSITSTGRAFKSARAQANP